MFRVLNKSKIPLFLLHKKSNHIFTIWQHIVLLVLRQYEGKSNRIFITVWQHLVVLLTIKQYERKSYRMFAEWSIEAHYFRIFLQLSKIPHFTTLQKFADRINNVMLGKIISSFVVLTGTGRIHIFVDML